jgi:hypothetical protein
LIIWMHSEVTLIDPSIAVVCKRCENKLIGSRCG